MTIKLLNTDFQECEMVENIPVHTFSTGNKLAENRYLMDNCYGRAKVKELQTSHFCLSDSTIRCQKDCMLSSETENDNVFWFCAILRGNNFQEYYNTNQERESWFAGHANLLMRQNVRIHDFYVTGKSLRTIHFMLSATYIERVACHYPDLFENLVTRFLRKESFSLFPRNVMFCTEMKRILNNLFDYKVAGNAAIMYLDSRILEVLSLLMCKSMHTNCSRCSHLSANDKDKLMHAKLIIEQQYLNPPSLHQLALMVGTNNCKLKIGFKELFGSTVFEYLINYRMKLACKYLLDTDMSMLEIANCIGYEYHSHFSTAFKRKIGISPIEYRINQLKKV